MGWVGLQPAAVRLATAPDAGCEPDGLVTPQRSLTYTYTYAQRLEPQKRKEP